MPIVGGNASASSGYGLGSTAFRRLFFPVAVALLAGCSVSALDMEEPGIDPSVVTGSIAPAPETTPPAHLPVGTDAMLHAMVAEMGKCSTVRRRSPGPMRKTVCVV